MKLTDCKCNNSSSHLVVNLPNILARPNCQNGDPRQSHILTGIKLQGKTAGTEARKSPQHNFPIWQSDITKHPVDSYQCFHTSHLSINEIYLTFSSHTLIETNLWLSAFNVFIFQDSELPPLNTRSWTWLWHSVIAKYTERLAIGYLQVWVIFDVLCKMHEVLIFYPGKFSVCWTLI